MEWDSGCVDKLSFPPFTFFFFFFFFFFFVSRVRNDGSVLA